MKTKSQKKYWASFNRFEFELPEECVRDCSHSGRCDEDVEFWANQLSISVNPADLKAELREYGAWTDAELSDYNDNLRRIIWIAAGNIRDEQIKD